MKYGFAGIGVLLAGLLSLTGIYYVLDGTIINEEDYHGLKEAMEAAMVDAIDIDYYQKTGEIKIIKEKFVEDFTRRFVNTTKYGKKGYTIEFYDIIESPPKASIIITGHSGSFRLTLDNDDYSSYDILNRLDAILKYNGKHLYTYEYYAFTNKDSFDARGGEKLLGMYTRGLKVPEEIKKVYNISDSTPSWNASDERDICQIVNAEYVNTLEKDKALDAYRTFYSNKDIWYFQNTQMVLQSLTDPSTLTNDNFCEVEVVTNFEFYTAGDNKNWNDRIMDPVVTLKDSSCMNNYNKYIGYKFKITWECSQ